MAREIGEAGALERIRLDSRWATGSVPLDPALATGLAGRAPGVVPTDIGYGEHQVPASVLIAGVGWMKRYSERTGGEACGVVIGWEDREWRYWRFCGLANMARESRHAFKIDGEAVQKLLQVAARVGIRQSVKLSAVMHNHPYADMGSEAWCGASDVDRRQAAAAVSQMGEGVLLPLSLVHCNTGMLVNYTEGGTKWSIRCKM